MTESTAEIERIVREVIRRLQSPKAVGEKPTQAPSCATNGDRAELVVRQRVISLAALDGQLEQPVRRLVVPHGAVLTPSVRDELRARGIELKYYPLSGGEGRANSNGVIFAAWQTQYDGVRLLDLLRNDGHEVNRMDADDGLKTVVQCLSRADSEGNCLGLVLTDRPALALCLASRPPSVRTAWGIDQHSVEQAFADVAPNLLIVQPSRHSLSAMANIARTFLRGGGGNCPTAVSDELASTGAPPKR